MKYVPGELTGTLSGSIGAKTAAHNKYGAYFRTRSTPVNPNSSRQQAVRSAFGSCVQAWKTTLTDLQRYDWKKYADQTPVTDRLGQTIYLSALNMFIRVNVVRLQIGSSIIAPAPTTYNTGEPVAGIKLSNDETPDTLGVTLAGTNLSTNVYLSNPASDDGDLVISIGPPLNATTQFFKGPYQLMLSATLGDSETDVDLDQALTVLLNGNGAPTNGEIRPVRLRIAYDDGRLSQSYSLIAPVAAESA